MLRRVQNPEFFTYIRWPQSLETLSEIKMFLL
jgi:hypothetical protein